MLFYRINLLLDEHTISNPVYIKNRKAETMRDKLLDLGADLLGSLLLAAGVCCFAEGVRIAPGGVSGLALIVQALWGVPIGLAAFCMNLPLLAIAWHQLGKGFLWRTLRTLIISTLFMDIIAALAPVYHGERLTGSICAGVLSGAGLGMIFLRGSTTAGTDILSRLLSKKYPQIPMGMALLAVDGVVLLLSVTVYRDWQAGLFGAAALYCQTKAINAIMYGMERGSSVLIVSREGKLVVSHILDRLGRGATMLEAWGAYSGQPCSAIVTAVRPSEIHRLRQLVHQYDPHAFVIVSEARQIYGEGFQGIPYD